MGIALCLALTRQQLGYWQDGETLFRHAIAVTVNNHIAHNNLGNACLEKSQMVEAIHQYQEAFRGKPRYAQAHYNLGNVYFKQDQTEAAIGQYLAALRLDPNCAQATKTSVSRSTRKVNSMRRFFSCKKPSGCNRIMPWAITTSAWCSIKPAKPTRRSANIRRLCA